MMTSTNPVRTGSGEELPTEKKSIEEQRSEMPRSPNELMEARDSLYGYEMEISFNEESDLHDALIMCKKNPGHNNFVSVKDVSLELLPDGWKDKELLKDILRMAQKTVKLSVNYVSENRPKNAFLHKYRGKRVKHTASGWMNMVNERKVDNGDDPCECHLCLESGQRKDRWFEVLIDTAKHVVHDMNEAKETIVEIGMDDGETEESAEKLVPLRLRQKPDMKDDAMTLVCAAHNENVLDIFNKPIQFVPAVKPQGPPLTIVVSHPHGCNKQVSIGYEKGMERKSGFASFEERVYSYDTATCPGSSGGPVWVVGSDMGIPVLFPHSGHDNKAKVNKSGPATVFVPREFRQHSGTAGNLGFMPEVEKAKNSTEEYDGHKNIDTQLKSSFLVAQEAMDRVTKMAKEHIEQLGAARMKEDGSDDAEGSAQRPDQSAQNALMQSLMKLQADQKEFVQSFRDLGL